MNSVEKFEEKLKNIPILKEIYAFFDFLAPIATGYSFLILAIKVITKAPFLDFLPLIIFCFVLSIIVFFILKNMQSIQFHKTRNKKPENFITGKLKFIARKKLNLTVAGRTDINWFENTEEKKSFMLML